MAGSKKVKRKENPIGKGAARKVEEETYLVAAMLSIMYSVYIHRKLEDAFCEFFCAVT